MIIIPSNVSAAKQPDFDLWLEASDWVGGTEWAARSGPNAINYGPKTASAFNGFPAIIIPSSSYFYVPNFSVGPRLALYAVMAEAGQPLIVEQSTNGNNLPGFYFYTNNVYPYNVFRSGKSGSLAFAPGSSSDWFSGFGLASIRFDGVQLDLAKNGVPVANSVARGLVAEYNNDEIATDTLYIGARGGSSLWFDYGYLLELIVSSDVSDDSYQSTISYLKGKYSL